MAKALSPFLDWSLQNGLLSLQTASRFCAMRTLSETWGDGNVLCRQGCYNSEMEIPTGEFSLGMIHGGWDRLSGAVSDNCPIGVWFGILQTWCLMYSSPQSSLYPREMRSHVDQITKITPNKRCRSGLAVIILRTESCHAAVSPPDYAHIETRIKVRIQIHMWTPLASESMS